MTLIALMLFVLVTGFSGGDDTWLARIGAAIDLYNDAFTEITTHYVDPLDPLRLTKEAIAGMVAALDPYTVFIDERNRTDMETMTTGRYAGLGVNISYRGNKAILNDFLIPPDSFGGHLHIGDELVAIDGTDIRGMQEDAIRRMLRGELGSTLALRIARPGRPETEAVLPRREIVLPTISHSGIIRDSIAYIKLDRFSAYATDRFRTTLSELLTHRAVKGVIVDLRDNPGGLLNASVDIAGFFLPQFSRIVSTLGTNPNYTRDYTCHSESLCPSLPLAVLIDDGSASASEIMAGAIQDHDRGVIVGEKSFGKGLVQNFVTLNDGYSMKITTSRYMTPSGRCIQKAGFADRVKDTTDARARRDTTHVFRTLVAARPVHDRGGITPDIELSRDSVPPYFASSPFRTLLFDFITIIRSESAGRTRPVFDHAMMLRLCDHVDSTMKGAEESLAALEQLDARARRDGWPEPLLTRIRDLRAEASGVRRHLIAQAWPRLIPLLERQYAWHSGIAATRFAADLQHDRQLLAAIRVLSNPAEYRAILSPR